MSERAAFIEAIAAEPEDDVRRLAFADWLQEHGEGDRAEFIRWMHELSSSQAELKDPLSLTDELRTLQARILKRFESRGAEWFEPFCHALGANGTRPTRQERWHSRLLRRLSGKPRRTAFTLRDFQFGHGWIEGWGEGPINKLGLWHGFVNHARLHLDSPLPVLDIGGAFRLEPINSVWLKVADNPDQWRRVNAPCLTRVAELTVEVPGTHRPQTVDAFEAILHGRHWSGLRSLQLWRDFIDFQPTPHEYVERLADSPILSDLRSLSLQFEQPVLLPLSSNPRLKNLSTFDAWGARLADDAADALADAVFRPNLEKLKLTNNRFGREAPVRLASVVWPKLQELDLGCNEIGDAGARGLMPLVPQLTSLSLTSNAITDAGALALADAIDPENLESLWLSYNPLSADTVAVLRARFGDRFHFRTRAEDGLDP